MNNFKKLDLLKYLNEDDPYFKNSAKHKMTRGIAEQNSSNQTR